MMAAASVTMTARKRYAGRSTGEGGSETRRKRLRRLKSELNISYK